MVNPGVSVVSINVIVGVRVVLQRTVFGECVVPENIHDTPPQQGLEIPGGWGSQRPKNLEKCMEFNWNFQKGGGSFKKSLLWERYGYFMEPHNGVLVTPE